MSHNSTECHERKIDVHFPSHDYVPGKWAALGGFGVGLWTLLSLVFWLLTQKDGTLFEGWALGWKWALVPFLWGGALLSILVLVSYISPFLGKMFGISSQKIPQFSSFIYSVFLTGIAVAHISQQNFCHQLLGKVWFGLLLCGCLGKWIIQLRQARKIQNSWGQLKGTSYQSSETMSER